MICVSVCMMLRVDSTSVESVASKIVMVMEGAKLAAILPTKSQYTCLRSEELKVIHFTNKGLFHKSTVITYILIKAS